MPDAGGFSTRRTVLIATVVIGILAFILQIVGCATPGWVVAYLGSFRQDFSFELHISVGLWSDQVKLCINGVCETYGVAEYLKLFGISINISTTRTEYKVETIIGIISMFAAIALILILLCHKNPTYGFGRTVLVFACLAAVLSCVMALIASGKLGNDVLTAHNDLGAQSPFLISYSVIITGVGGILAAVVFFLLAIETCNINTRGVPNQQGQTIVMASYPQNVGHYVVPAQNSGYPQPAGATSLYAHGNTQRSGHLVVGQNPPSGNYLVTRY